jgi:hypothetical protein
MMTFCGTDGGKWQMRVIDVRSLLRSDGEIVMWPRVKFAVTDMRCGSLIRALPAHARNQRRSVSSIISER